MPSFDFVIPGNLDTPTGGYIYDREIIAGLRAHGWSVTVRTLDDSYPDPTLEAQRATRETFAEIADGTVVVIDGLALPGLERLLAKEAQRLTIVALVHHPVAYETGLGPKLAARYADAERRALAFAKRVITTSHWTARALGEFDVPVAALRVAEPGIDARVRRHSDGRPRRAPPSSGVSFLCVATLTPRKGHSVLFEALAEVRDRSWHLRCAGSLHRDPEHLALLEHQIDRLGLKSRLSLLGELGPEALAREYARADVFVLASFLEGYGMALAEAVANGLPVISTTGGAIPETVPADASILVPPGDSRALAKALAHVLDDPADRLALTERARKASSALPSWRDTTLKFARALDGLVQAE